MKLLDWLRTDSDPNPDEWDNYDLHAALAFALMRSRDLTAETGKWYDLSVSFKLEADTAEIDGIRVTPNRRRSSKLPVRVPTKARAGKTSIK